MRQDPPHTTTFPAFLAHAISSWGTTTRLIAVLIVCTTLLLGGAHLLDLTVTAGPVEVAPR
ncbi:hypothetical protein ACFPM7_27020 [Actinokineospora guangxiensis]|uniref:Uncharacterized protein n=1 Tax=Actinokineospora guangxiensis TaxID=1490288 RepID=A0ABW0EYT0_9PSEU